MQEFTIRYDNFHKGLRSSRYAKRSRPLLTECYNLRPVQQSLVSIQPITTPRPAELVTYPFPQLAIGSRFFQLNRDSIKVLGSDFSLSQTFHVRPGSSWHWADFGSYWVFANGIVSFEYDPVMLILRPTVVSFTTCCNYNGQLFVGGLPFCGAPLESPMLIEYVGWSKIGSAEFVLDATNTSGCAPMSKNAICLRVLKLGEHVMAYGDSAIDIFTPVIEPVATFGKQFLDLIPGVAGRSAVGGTELVHVLVDSVGQLWRITSSMKPELLGYQNLFEQMLGNDIIVSHNMMDNSFTITDGQVSYLLSEGGLSRQFQAITSQTVHQGGVIGFSEFIDDQGFELKTDPLDFGYAGLKTLTSVELVFRGSSTVFAGVDWRSSSTDQFKPSKWVRLNERGQARLNITACEFCIKFQSSNYQNIEIDYMLVKYQASDRRNLRGAVHADQTDTRTDSK